MKSRLNLTIDEDVVHDTKLYAEKHGTSISEMVENYLKNIVRPIKRKSIVDMMEEVDLPPIASDIDLKEQYFKERAKKYGF